MKNEKVYLFVGRRPIVSRRDFHGYDLMNYLGVNFSCVLHTKFKNTFVEDYYVKGGNPYLDHAKINEEFKLCHSTNDYDIKPPSRVNPFLEFINFKRINDSNKFGVKDCLNPRLTDPFFVTLPPKGLPPPVILKLTRIKYCCLLP